MLRGRSDSAYVRAIGEEGLQDESAHALRHPPFTALPFKWAIQQLHKPRKPRPTIPTIHLSLRLHPHIIPHVVLNSRHVHFSLVINSLSTHPSHPSYPTPHLLSFYIHNTRPHPTRSTTNSPKHPTPFSALAVPAVPPAPAPLASESPQSPHFPRSYVPGAETGVV